MVLLTESVPLPVPEGEAVEAGMGEAGSVALPERELLALLLALAPEASKEVGEVLTVLLAERK